MESDTLAKRHRETGRQGDRETTRYTVWEVRDGVKICPLIFVLGMIDLRRKKVRGILRHGDMETLR